MEDRNATVDGGWAASMLPHVLAEVSNGIVFLTIAVLFVIAVVTAVAMGKGR